MIRAAIVAILLLVATPANAGVLAWAEGGESQTKLVMCAGASTTGSQYSVDTTNVRSGSAAIKVSRGSSTTGKCSLVEGLSAAGTVYVTGALFISQTSTCVAGDNSLTGSLLDLGEVTVKLTCATGTSNYVMSVQENATTVGATPTLSNGSWYPFLIKIVTGAGSASVNWSLSTDGSTWTDQGCTNGGCTGRTITSVTQAIWAHPNTTSVGSFYSAVLDDFVLLDGPSTGEPTVATYVNTRASKSTTPNANAWTQTGGSGTINTVWSQRAEPSTTFPGSQYATSGNTSSLGQTELFNSWASGTPTPAIPASAVGVMAIYGCHWDIYSGRNSGTARTYNHRLRWNATDDDTRSETMANGSYGLFQYMFDPPNGSDAATILTRLDGMELGSAKSSGTSGATMVTLDQWVQCAWSISAGVAGAMWSD
ncbi:MAG: hypothetical protein ABIR79_12630 [Candidatus Binatia bacterium]